jgi:hypothetical protein
MFTEKLNNIDSCLTNENFDLVKNFIIRNGIQLKLYKSGIIADTTTLSKQMFLNGRTIALIDYQNYQHIIVIDKFNQDKIPVYFVSNLNEPCQISAYYSRIDTGESIKIRKYDWYKLTIEIKNVKSTTSLVDRKTALKIAQKDAQSAYSDLSVYTVKAKLKVGCWYVDYYLSDPSINGGGPHYIICGKSGNIMTRRYEQ